MFSVFLFKWALVIGVGVTTPAEHSPTFVLQQQTMWASLGLGVCSGKSVLNITLSG